MAVSPRGIQGRYSCLNLHFDYRAWGQVIITPDNGAQTDGAQTDGAQTDGAQTDGAQIDGAQVMAGSAEAGTTQAAIDRFHQILGKQDIAEATWRLLVCEQRAVGLQVQG